jgi:telomere length regulation protein
VLGPRKNLFSQIQWSNKPVSFGLLKATLYIYSFKSFFLALFPLIKHADITAAIGLCLEKLTKKELETTKDVLNSILQGVSCEFLSYTSA